MPQNKETTRYLHQVNEKLYPGLIDQAHEWVTEGWGSEEATAPMLATAVLNQANDSDTEADAREQMLVVVTNILNFYYRGEQWTEKPFP